MIESPESYTAEEITAERNSEVVRALAERLGWPSFLERVGSTLVNEWTDPRTGLRYELLDIGHRFGERQPRLLRMQSPPLNDGSQPWYIERVDHNLETAQAARRWKFRKANGEFPSAEWCNRNPSIEFTTET